MAAEKTNEEAKISIDEYKTFKRNMEFRPKNYTRKLKDVSDLIDEIYDGLGGSI